MNTQNEQSRVARILAYVEEHPGCSVIQICAHFDFTSKVVNADLRNLAGYGCIVRTNPDVVRPAHWKATGRPVGRGSRVDRARQIITKTWVPHLVRHPLDVALFGPPEIHSHA